MVERFEIYSRKSGETVIERLRIRIIQRKGCREGKNNIHFILGIGGSNVHTLPQADVLV